jgi:hypothetical protein
MATLATLAPRSQVQATPRTHSPKRTPGWITARWFAILSALSATTLLVHGYHPLAEDGGLYVTGVEHLLNPTLFPHDTAFVTAHLRFSLFAPLVAGVVRITHLPLPWILLLVELFSITLTLFAARLLLRRCLPGDAAQLGGIALLAAWWTLPVAATSLMLFDPYVTARSLSTPLSLLAIAFALDWTTKESRVAHSSLVLSLSKDRDGLRSIAACIACLLLAALVHPLMAAYALAFVVVLVTAARATGRRRLWLWTLLTVIALASAAIIHLLAPAESPAVIAAAHSRYYWFLSQWRWYEHCGLAGPLVVFALLLRAHLSRAADALCRAAIGLGLISVLIALLFAHDSAPTHLVARLQPLRAFLLLYAVMALLLGAALTRRALQSQRRLIRLLPVATLLAIAAILFACQRRTFPASPHLELPMRAAANPHNNAWSRAFLWARDNTPVNALFALDADYISLPGEDAQTFRATAQRSALPDYSKDGGEASITPSLATLWQQGVTAQTNLSTEPDARRDARLLPLGVTWLALRSTAVTTHPCPYDNGTVKLCRLTP